VSLLSGVAYSHTFHRRVVCESSATFLHPD